jgi:hypothetical protein
MKTPFDCVVSNALDAETTYLSLTRGSADRI